MRNIIFGALLASAVVSPAAARDNSFYAGVEGGVWEVSNLTGKDKDVGSKATGTFDTGYDVDFIAGYDWGLLRTEAELGYKRANFDNVRLDGTFFLDGSYKADGYAEARTASINLLLDFDIGPGFSLYGGPGLGYGWVKLHPKLEDGGGSSKLNDERDSGLYGQLIAGARYAVTPNLDFGLKARHIMSGKLKYDSGFPGDLKGRFRASSLLVSLIYNFGSVAVEAPPPPPPPPPAPEPIPAPATQTCADGRVILASDSCPPPPPPPPPAAEPERG